MDGYMTPKRRMTVNKGLWDSDDEDEDEKDSAYKRNKSL